MKGGARAGKRKYVQIRALPSGDLMVLEAGIEPAHPCGYRILSPVRLPVSPLQQQWPPGGTLASGSRSVKVAVEDGDRREI